MTEEKSRKRLLAKSPRDGRDFPLRSHLLETKQSARRVFRLDKRWGQNWCRFFGLTTKKAQKRFLLNLYVAALLHDIGKANADFYRAVTTPGFTPQAIRHEHLSALVLHLQNVRAWLRGNTVLDVEVITAAVLSHHLKAQGEKGEWQWCQAHGKNYVKLALHDEDIRAVLTHIRRIAHLGEIPELPREDWSDKSLLWTKARIEGGDCAIDFGLVIEQDDERHRLLLAVKAGLIVADSVASGLVRKNYGINKWIDEKVHSPAVSESEISDEIIKKRIEQIEKSKGKPFKGFHNFQKRTAELSSRALLLASCGSGKTLAAWKWAEAQVRKHRVGKVIFLYPTRGTATEGFRDYVGWAPEASAALITGTSRYELEAMKENPSEEKNESTRGKNYLKQEDERLFALAWWSRRFFSATVDQFLGFMEHSYSSLCLLPVLADSVLIVDEVHSYDRKMFEVLINFLRTFNLPVLCMTATLSQKRIDQLEELGFQKYPKPADYKELSDLCDAENHPRYKLEPATNKEEALRRALAAYRDGKRVLWVVNVVDRCQETAQFLTNRHGINTLCYHSRFTLEERKKVHDDTVKAFQQRDAAAIAVTTQVCEMSLDLDADVLITEVAPPSSLVQRFGRANRHLDGKSAGFRAELLVYSTDHPAPYTTEEIQAGNDFLDALGTGEISQRRLADVLEDHAPD
ncbi:MAG: CRISPR-associated helicase Cas3', partial [Pyrinomonadaceae bacterium]